MTLYNRGAESITLHCDVIVSTEMDLNIFECVLKCLCRVIVITLVPETGQSVILFWLQIFLVPETGAG